MQSQPATTAVQTVPKHSFEDLLLLHTRLDELFLDHQRALLRLDITSALTALEAYETALHAHMSDEEDLMLPLYRDRAQIPMGGAVEIFINEHEKLRQYILLFKEAVTKLEAAQDLEREVLWLLDSQHLFKRLLVHHDTRERRILYPLLDQVTTEQERQSLFSLLQSPPLAPATAANPIGE